MILDLFAGPGGWDEGARLAGHAGHLIGIDHEPAACRTAEAAGHERICADVASYPTAPFAGKVTGLVASPPCQDFSTAGPTLYGEGRRGQLVYQARDWTLAVRPRWTAWEQVRGALPFWRAFAPVLEEAGYYVWCGLLNTADYGLPQERIRAILIASCDVPVGPPLPTHAETPGMFGPTAPWATLADALGLGRGWSYDSGQNSRAAGGTTERYVRSCDRPAGTVTGQSTGQWVLRRGTERRKLTTVESAVLQGFPADYPFQGKREEREQQIGDAVPPPFAAAILRPLIACVEGVAA